MAGFHDIVKQGLFYSKAAYCSLQQGNKIAGTLA